MARSQNSHNPMQPNAESPQPSGQPELRTFHPNQHASSSNHVQLGAEQLQPLGQPEHCTFHPNQHTSTTRIFSPLSSSSTVQSQASASTPAQNIHQRNMFFFQNGINSCTPSLRPHLEMPTSQNAYQPAQQQMSPSTGHSSLLNNANQHMYQPSRLRPGTPHGQSGRGLFQPRHHPYAASQSRPSQYPSSHNLQATLPVLSPGDMSSSPSRSDTPAQTYLPAASQIQTPNSQDFLRYLQEFQQTQGSRNTSQPEDQIRSQAMLPGSTMYNPAQLHVRHVSQSSSVGTSPSSVSQVQSPAQSYGRVQLPTPSTPHIPLSSKPIPKNLTHVSPCLSLQTPMPSQSKTQPPVQGIPQAPQQPSNLTPSRPPPTLKQPSPPRIWCPDLRTATYPSLPLQAQPEEESNHPHQKTLVGKTQERALANIRPHAFIDHLTMDHNACFKPKVARVFDMLFMQALLFYKDNVFLVSPKELQTPCWEPPQSIWHACDLHRPEAVSPVQVEHHIYKALNLFSDLQPDEVVYCVNHGRHDSAVNLVRNNSELTYGWSVSLSFDFKNETYASRFRKISPDLNVVPFSENKIKDLNMDPVWKAKVLEIFKLRRES
ncbi:hypothetical protein KCU98_g3358, partial [Aureobasidium melanogenum]